MKLNTTKTKLTWGARTTNIKSPVAYCFSRSPFFVVKTLTDKEAEKVRGGKDVN